MLHLTASGREAAFHQNRALNWAATSVAYRCTAAAHVSAAKDSRESLVPGALEASGPPTIS